MSFIPKSEPEFRRKVSLPQGREEKGALDCWPHMAKRALCLLALAFVSTLAGAQAPVQGSEPYVGQPGKDVIWVPTPPTLVEKMLDMAAVTPQDLVMDLGSGDGRNIIAAAKRGARAVGVEYDDTLVALSRRRAEEEGVAHLARFVQGDMYEADISQATVLALFLLPDNLEKLKPRFEKLKPGSRIVTNGYRIIGWDEKEVGVSGGDCAPWCTAYLYVVPARAD
jgi:SAM-dependent methyltransferase